MVVARKSIQDAGKECNQITTESYTDALSTEERKYSNPNGTSERDIQRREEDLKKTLTRV